ncbi:MAG: S1C family serine protease [Lachnospiraceae bacterium]
MRYTKARIVKEHAMSMEQNKETKEHSQTQDHEQDHVQNQTEGPEQEEYSFLQETIKEEPLSTRKMLSKIGKAAGIGLIFGLASSLGFFALKPWAETKFQKDPKTVTIPKDETEQGEPVDGEVIPEVVPPSFTAENYQALHAAMSEVATKVNKSVVKVEGLKGTENWTETGFHEENSVAGVIIFDNGQETLILTDSSILKDATSIAVTFTDNSVYAATLKQKDENLGLAILSVADQTLRDNTKAQVEVATLGNSNLTKRGDVIIALGNPFGYAGGMGLGVVSSSRYSTDYADGDYGVLLTDIGADPKATGILVNFAGEVVGVIEQQVGGGENMTFLSALAISDLKDVIELLSNGSVVPYIGVMGTDVPEDISQGQGLPKGVYVKEVAVDSPAMSAGIQSGDIITSVGKTKVTTLMGYQKALIKETAGERVRLNGQRSGNGGYIDISFNVTVGGKE